MLFPLNYFSQDNLKSKKESRISGGYCIRRQAEVDGLVGISTHTELFLGARWFGHSSALAGDRQEQAAWMGELCRAMAWLG